MGGREVENGGTTICVQCVHYRHEVVNKASPNVWYNHVCGHPSVERQLTLDPVTGERRYVGGRHPFCREVNRDGACELYEAK